MFTRVHKAHQVAGGDNKGSSSALMDYLDKENKDKEKDEKQGFFNDEKDDISKIKARNIIDSNNVRLGEKDTKFYMLSINPSWREIEHLEKEISKETKEEFDKTNKNHVKLLDDKIKDYTKDVMKIYADCFFREKENKEVTKQIESLEKELKEGKFENKLDKFDKEQSILELKEKQFERLVIDPKEINYVAKVEHQRTFKHYDKEVKHNDKILKEINALKDQMDNPKTLKEQSVFGQVANENRIKKLEKELFKQDKEGNITKGGEGKIIRTDGVKEGRNLHVHVVVSRQTKSKYYKGEKVVDEKGMQLTSDKEKLDKAKPILLSPNAKGKASKVNHFGKNIKVGFTHEKFKKETGEKFQEKFNYKAQEKEQYRANILEKASRKAQRVKRNVAGKVKSEIKSKIKKEIRGEVGKTEEKLIKAATKSPVQTAKNLVREKLAELKATNAKEILKGKI